MLTKKFRTGFWITIILILGLALAAAAIIVNSRDKELRIADANLSDCINTAQICNKEKEEMDSRYKASIKLPSERLTTFIAVFIKSRQPRISTDVANLIAKAIVKHSNGYDLPPGLLTGIIEAESYYDPMVISKAKARGLMQITFKIWGKALHIKNYKELYEIEPNIRYGSKILRILLKQEGTLSKALSKYLGTKDSGKYRAKVLSVFAEFELDKHQFIKGKSKKEVPLPAKLPKKPLA